MIEPIKAMRKNWRQSRSLRRENAPLQKKRVSLRKLDFVLRYNWDPVIIPHRTIRVLVCKQSLRKDLGAVPGFSRQQIVAVCNASGISKVFMQMIYKFNDTVFERR